VQAQKWQRKRVGLGGPEVGAVLHDIAILRWLVSKYKWGASEIYVTDSVQSNPFVAVFREGSPLRAWANPPIMAVRSDPTLSSLESSLRSKYLELHGVSTSDEAIVMMLGKDIFDHGMSASFRVGATVGAVVVQFAALCFVGAFIQVQIDYIATVDVSFDFFTDGKAPSIFKVVPGLEALLLGTCTFSYVVACFSFVWGVTAFWLRDHIIPDHVSKFARTRAAATPRAEQAQESEHLAPASGNLWQ
jgi:hypothetical protein